MRIERRYTILHLFLPILVVQSLLGLTGCPLLAPLLQVAVPNVAGMAYLPARAALVSAGLNVGTVAQECNDTAAAGQVIRQDPNAGTVVATGATVNLVVSQGPNLKTVPNVAGAPQAGAETALTNAGLSVGTVAQEFDTAVAAGLVVAQNPAAGTLVSAGAIVDLVVSKGSNVRSIPSTAGMTTAAATAAITDAGFTLGAVMMEYNPNVPVGQVIRQEPGAGTQAQGGAPITLVVCALPNLPNVVGMTQASAESLIVSSGWSVHGATSEYHETAPMGQVIRQEPAAGTPPTSGATVDLVISRGPGPVFVPDVSGMTQAVAQSALISANLTLGTVAHEYVPAPATEVFSQEPTAGTLVERGTSVDLIISLGPPAHVPNLAGMTQVQAESAIVAAGLRVGTVTQQYTTAVPATQILHQNPGADASVAPGTVVNLIVSKGPESVRVPDLVGQTQAVAQRAIAHALLALGTVARQYSATAPVSQVISQDPVADFSVTMGTAVNISISQGPAPTNVPDVVGMTQVEAQSALVYALLSLGTVTALSIETVPVGQVLAQSPVNGTYVTCGTHVNLVIASHTPVATVPDVVGLAQAAAADSIANANLTVGEVKEATSFRIPAGIIMSQAPVAGTVTVCGTPVSLVVSVGMGADDRAYDFTKWLQAIYDSSAIDLLPWIYQGLRFYIDPATADVNGNGYIDLSTTGWGFSFVGNGMPECSTELKLVETVLNHKTFSLPNGLTHKLVADAWNKNMIQFDHDIGSYLVELVSDGEEMPKVLSGMMILGDGSYTFDGKISWTGSAGFIEGGMLALSCYGMVDNGPIDLSKYAWLPQYFAPDGDADGDGCTNRQEFDAYGEDPAAYVAAALDPDTHPDDCTTSAD